MSEINPSQMSREELKATAADLGLDFPANIPNDKLVARIRAHLGEPVAEPSDAVAEDHSDKGSGERVFEVTIATDSQDKQPVPLQVNGVIKVVKRGERVRLPESYVNVLEHAVQHRYDPATMERQDVLSYPYQIHGEVRG
jgi:hypothetical protein